MRSLLAAAIVALAVSTAPGALAATKHGDLTFPDDEHAHPAAWDYHWGAAQLVTTAGNTYTVGINYASFDGYAVSGHQVYPHQGPYRNRSILSPDGPVGWGHPDEEPGRFLREVSYHVPGVSDKLRIRTMDTADGGRVINSWERTTLESETYRFRLDNPDAEVHPAGKRVGLKIDMTADMKSPPLLAGGTGRWWYGIPESYGYPSRAFQYMQGARALKGTIAVQRPDGTMKKETIVSSRSQLEMVHEYDPNPEDIPVGLGLAQVTQLHPRYATNYHGGMPWELMFLDLRNGAQLMVAALAFHETEKGTVKPVVGSKQPTYAVLATLRLPDGRSVPLDNAVRLEHLSYRTLIGQVPTFQVDVQGIWKQGWDFRVTYPGGTAKDGAGKPVKVPSFDLGVSPQFAQSVPQADDHGNRQAQRVPLDAAGSWGGCPIRGFGWSELIINWYDKDGRDPWWTGGDPPPVPARCGDDRVAPPGGPQGDMTPTFDPEPPPNTTLEACTVYNPGVQTCAYTAKSRGGVGGGGEPGGWTVRITRPGLREPIVISSLGDGEIYACGTIRPGDRVELSATKQGANAFAGNPGFCF